MIILKRFLFSLTAFGLAYGLSYLFFQVTNVEDSSNSDYSQIMNSSLPSNGPPETIYGGSADLTDDDFIKMKIRDKKEYADTRREKEEKILASYEKYCGKHNVLKQLDIGDNWVPVGCSDYSLVNEDKLK